MKENYRSLITNKSLKRIVAATCVFAMILTSSSVLALTEVNKTTSSSGETSFEAYWNKDKTGGTFRFETGLEQKLTPKVLFVGELCTMHGLTVDVLNTVATSVLQKADLDIRLYQRRNLVYDYKKNKGDATPSLTFSGVGCGYGDAYADWIGNNTLDSSGNTIYDKLILIGDGLIIAGSKHEDIYDVAYYNCAQALKKYYDEEKLIILTAPLSKAPDMSNYLFYDLSLNTNTYCTYSLAFFAPSVYLSFCNPTSKAPDLNKYKSKFWPSYTGSSDITMKDSNAIPLTEYKDILRTDFDYMEPIDYDNSALVGDKLDEVLIFTYDKVTATLELNDGLSIEGRDLTLQYKAASGNWVNLSMGSGGKMEKIGNTITFTFDQPSGTRIRKVRAIGYWTDDGSFTEGDFIKNCKFEFKDGASLAANETLNSPVLSKDSAYKPSPFDPSDPSTFDGPATPVYSVASNPDTGDHNNVLIYTITFVLALGFAGIVLSASQNKEKK